MATKEYVAFAQSYEDFLYWCNEFKVEYTKVIYATPKWIENRKEEFRDFNLILFENGSFYKLHKNFSRVYLTYHDTPIVESGRIVDWKMNKSVIKGRKPKIKDKKGFLTEDEYIKAIAIGVSKYEEVQDIDVIEVFRYLLRQYNIPVPPQQGETL